MKYLSNKIDNIEPQAIAKIFNLVKEMEQNGAQDIVSLGAGEPCFDTPMNIKSAAWAALKGGKTKYQPTAGDYELRKEICKKFQRDNDIHVGVDQVVVTLGAKFAIYLAFQAVLEEGDQVMILDPAWVTYEPAAKMAGADVVRVSSNKLDGFQPNLDVIEQTITDTVKIVVINSPCNPTGAVYESDAIRKITEMAKAKDALILSDEPYEYLVYQGQHYSPGADFDNVITVNAFSKSYAMTGWRLGYVTAPQSILEGMVKIYQHSASCVNSFSQAGGIEALHSEKSHHAKEKMVEGYSKRRTEMVNLIEKSEFFELHSSPQGAFYCFPSYNFDKPSVDFSKELLEETHVATIPGAAFGKCGEGHLRLSYSNSVRSIREAFDRINTYLTQR